MADQHDRGAEVDLPETSSSEDRAVGLRRREFIKRLAKTGAIAPTAALLYNASSTPAAAGD